MFCIVLCFHTTCLFFENQKFRTLFFLHDLGLLSVVFAVFFLKHSAVPGSAPQGSKDGKRGGGSDQVAFTMHLGKIFSSLHKFFGSLF